MVVKLSFKETHACWASSVQWKVDDNSLALCMGFGQWEQNVEHNVGSRMPNLRNTSLAFDFWALGIQEQLWFCRVPFAGHFHSHLDQGIELWFERMNIFMINLMVYFEIGFAKALEKLS